MSCEKLYEIDWKCLYLFHSQQSQSESYLVSNILKLILLWSATSFISKHAKTSPDAVLQHKIAFIPVT